jgi:3-hydroxybutyryl-CoA dehydrogenase
MNIERICVVGAGTMGHGIAQVAAMSGFDTLLVDLDRARLEQARQRITANLDKGIARGKVSAELRQAALARLQTSVDLAQDASDAQLFVESVPEQAALKCRVLAQCAAVAAEDAIIATNTSSLPLAQLVDALPAPDRFIGLHFFNPVHIQPLLEIVVTDHTSTATRQACLEVAAAMGKEPIVVRDSPGFASSRLGLALGLEAIRMLEEGIASAEDIDKAMALGYRHPMGPLRLTDLVGLDVRLAIAEILAREIDPVRFAPPALLKRLVSEGKLGKKTGHGFYRY